jgi:hypothetical protein
MCDTPGQTERVAGGQTVWNGVVTGYLCNSILYVQLNRVTWDERKRRGNIQLHGLDFAGAEEIWDGFTITREDIRRDYGKKWWVTFGLLRGEVVVLVHTELGDDDHYISLRRAEPYETRYYIETVKGPLH